MAYDSSLRLNIFLTSSGGNIWANDHCDDPCRARAITKSASTGNDLLHALHCAISCVVLTIFTIAALRCADDNTDQQPVIIRSTADQTLIGKRSMADRCQVTDAVPGSGSTTVCLNATANGGEQQGAPSMMAVPNFPRREAEPRSSPSRVTE
jgi:hypothetical protein